MKEARLEEQLRLLEKEIALLGESIESVRMDLQEQMGKITIELDVLKAFLMHAHPDFKTQYPRLKEIVTTQKEPKGS